MIEKFGMILKSFFETGDLDLQRMLFVRDPVVAA